MCWNFHTYFIPVWTLFVYILKCTRWSLNCQTAVFCMLDFIQQQKDTWFFQWYKLSSENRFYHQKVLSVSTKSNMRKCNKFGSKHRFTCFVICSNSAQTSIIKFITVINKNYGLFLLWFWWNSAVHLSL